MTTTTRGPSDAQRDKAREISCSVRAERTRMRAHVYRGGSLAILMRERREALNGVEVVMMLRWFPLFGKAKATRMARGFPPRVRFGALTLRQRGELIARVAEYERNQIQRRSFAAALNERN